MSEDLSNLVYSKNIIEFLTVASEYCGFIEKSEKFSKKDFIEKSQKILALLYLKASLIDKYELEVDGDIERFVTEDDYNNIQQTLSEKFGTHEQFLDVWEPRSTESSEAVQVSFSECFTDIYQDLKDFVLNYQIGNEEIMSEIIHECRLNFELFWGPRVIAVLAIIHNLIYSGENLDDDEEDEKKSENKSKITTKNWLINKKFEDYQDNVDSDALDDLFGNDED